MKLRHILYAVLLAVLLASCDGSVLVEVVTAEDTPDKNYQKILGVVSGTVYYQNNKGLFSNSSSSEQGSDIYSKVLQGENTLVANSNGALVQYSCLYDSQYLLYFQSDRNSNDGYRSTIGLYDLNSGTNYPSVPLSVTGVTATSDGYWIKGLHEDGGLVVFDDANDKVYLCYPAPAMVNSSAVTFTALTDSNSVLDVANTSSMQYDVGAYYFQRTQAKTYSMMTRVHKVNNDEEDDDDYDADLYFFKWNSGVPSLLAKSSGTHPYRPANFVINSSEKAAYVLCTNGRLYKYSLVSETATEIDYKSSGYSYGTGCMMYYISSGGKEYIVTKPNYKSRAIIVLEFTEDTAGATEIADFDDSSLRKGFAYRLDSDLINCFYELRTDVSSKSNLLAGTNESGMVSITINWDNVTNNSSSNGSTSASEQYDTTL
ncbi:MAG: hypothetical protein SPF89_01955 [Sphaerochaetaceae bacterium]|nr:hypothetical protein [Spirochaetales bacterium]MDY5498850.1 hypothetical protein [Sphaerochaetaceae bacterium]